jgi:hypothetical protein
MCRQIWADKLGEEMMAGELCLMATREQMTDGARTIAGAVHRGVRFRQITLFDFAQNFEYL